ncbi:hypothetical protein GJAV_G00254220 [Gymnothorax javanicus]|nr:hypothetical protein GJAV_G00254220 [Gymnothorax javanicus]
METRSAGNIPTREINPKYAYSAGHTWAFGAFAELIDNACDPIVNAENQWIDWTQIKDRDCLTFTDDGAGLPYDTMLKMMSGKKTIRGHAPVGQYGNGFKSGSMRLGKDVIVFSKTRDTMSVGLLSQTYRKTNQDKHKLVPIAILRKEGDTHILSQGRTRNAQDHEDSLKAILEYSLFNTEEELQRELQAISTTSSGGSTGTRIIIWNLRSSHGKVEFDFETDPYDIRIPKGPNGPGTRVHILTACLLQHSLPEASNADHHQGKEGSNSAGLQKSGPLPRGPLCSTIPGSALRSARYFLCLSAAVGAEIVSIAECDFLEPTDNKQDFEATERYRNFKKSLAKKLQKYWFATVHLKGKMDSSCTSEMEDMEKSAKQRWVQCDSCHKWRKVPDGIDANKLPERWFCHQNADPKFRTCAADQELEDSMDEELFTETIILEETEQQEEDRQQTAEDGASTSSTAATPSSSSHSGSELPQEGPCSPPRSRSGLKRREPSTRATARSKRSLFSTSWSTRAKRAKADDDSSSLSTDTEEFLASCQTVPYVVPDDQIMDDVGAPVIQTEVAAPISVQERNQQLSDGAVPEEPMETSTRATATDPTSVVQQSVSVTTQTERAATLKEEPSEDQPNCLEQTQRQKEASNGGECPLLELAAEEQNWLRKQWEMATEERDQCRQQLEEAKQEKDQNRGQMETANQERDHYRTQLEAANQERDQYMAKVNQLKQELLQMRAGQVEPEPRDQASTGEDDLTRQWDSIFKDLSHFKDEMDQQRSKCEEQRRELEDLREAGSSTVSPRPAQSAGAGPSQPGSSEAERLKGLRLNVSRLLLMLDA